MSLTRLSSSCQCFEINFLKLVLSIFCLSVRRVRTCGHVDGKGVEAKLNLRRASSGLRQRCSSLTEESE